MLIIEPADPAAKGPRALLDASHQLMTALFPAEENHFLSIDALKAPGIAFFAARDGQDTLGTCALAACAGYGEVKSLFTAPAARGRGVARALMRHVEDAARADGLPLLRLETGRGLDAARALYADLGFVERGPFGAYAANRTSIFLEKAL